MTYTGYVYGKYSKWSAIIVESLINGIPLNNYWHWSLSSYFFSNMETALSSDLQLNSTLEQADEGYTGEPLKLQGEAQVYYKDQNAKLPW